MSPFGVAARLTQSRRISLGACCVMLLFIMLIAFALIGWWASQSHPEAGWQAAAVASLVCLISAIGALLLTGLVRTPTSSVAALFAGMLVRMGVPLAATVIFARRGGTLAESGVVGMTVAFYLIALTAETYLSLHLVHSREQSRGG